ncbi:MAG: AlpA family phage regulatory protein [Sphingomonas sp.]|nr:AlpA family phage regulatory protein [Sphingomonas sp.]
MIETSSSPWPTFPVSSGKSRPTLYRRAQSGNFPPPCNIGAGKIRWRSGDIEIC